MKSLSRVIWSEGMHLGPHHFQAQSRYFEDSIQFAMESLFPYAWGIAGCEIDTAALRNGTLSVVHCRGIFPDGLPFDMPEADALPPARAIGDLFPPTRDKLGVFLAVPSRRSDGQNVGIEGAGNEHRYTAKSYTAVDETTGRDERSLRLGSKNIRLMLDVEDAHHCSSLEIARVVRGAAGDFHLDADFIPPCLRITASDRLVFLLRRVIEIMEAKTSSLQPSRAATQQAFSARELASFWFAHTLNSSLLPLRHLCFVKHGHPEEVWLELSRLAGALCTFAMEAHPRSLPLYDHRKLDECFAELDVFIRTHLNLIVPTNSIKIPLERSSEFFWTGEVKDRRAFDRSDWILSIHSGSRPAEVTRLVPQLVKLCSRDFVPKLVERALPGMPLAHVAVPPAAISPSVETQYFAVAKGGPCWDHIQKSNHVGIYIPGGIPEPDPELLVVLGSE